jgi:uncharacterized protein DUF4157
MGEKVQVAAKKPEVKRENQASHTRNADQSQSMSSPVDQVLYLQRTIGNQAVQRLIKSGALQAKLRIGQPGDRYEQEADRVADEVMRMPEPQAVPDGESNIQRACPTREEEELRRQPIEEEEELQRQPIEEEELQVKAISGNISEVNPNLESQIQSLKGGQPLSEKNRAFFEPRFSADFSGVRVHTDSNANHLARSVNAKAFTVGKDIVFGSGQFSSETTGGQKLLAHELTHTIQQTRVYPHIARHIIQRRPISRAEERAARTHARANYDEMSVRIIQHIAGAGMDGNFGPITALAVSNFQTTNIAAVVNDDGRVLQDTLDLMITNRVAAGRRNEAIHLVTDFFNLDITSDTLSVYSDPGASRANPTPPPATFPADTTFESGNLRVIRIGTAAFADAATLGFTIRRELNRVAPAVAGPAAPTPAILNRRQVRRAIRYMNNHYQDRRSIMALQGLFPGVNPTGTVDADLVQRIAEVQNTTPALALTDGKVGRFTLEHFFIQLRNSGNQNAAMRLVMDFYDMPNYNNLLTIYYQDTGGYTGQAGTTRNPRGPVRIRVRRALYMPFSAMVHSLRHELEHVGHHKEGILSPDTREFLGEATEIISSGMPHETLFRGSIPDISGTGLVNRFGFESDVNRMITRWGHMSPADQRSYWRTFVRARRVIRRRIARTYRPTRTADRAEWAAATPAQRAALTALLANVNAAVRPPP